MRRCAVDFLGPFSLGSDAARCHMRIRARRMLLISDCYRHHDLGFCAVLQVRCTPLPGVITPIPEGRDRLLGGHYPSEARQDSRHRKLVKDLIYVEAAIADHNDVIAQVVTRPRTAFDPEVG